MAGIGQEVDPHPFGPADIGFIPQGQQGQAARVSPAKGSGLGRPDPLLGAAGFHDGLAGRAQQGLIDGFQNLRMPQGGQ